MTVYVDDMHQYPMGEFKNPTTGFLMKMSHMIADTEAELHAMADKLGLKREWYQGDHYDVGMAKRKLAVRMGAVPITLMQCSAMSMIRGRDPNVKLVEPDKAEQLNLANRGYADWTKKP